jgi:hypothetical protein
MSISKLNKVGEVDKGKQVSFLTTELNEIIEKINEMVEVVNYLGKIKEVEYKYSAIYLLNKKKYEDLIESGVNVDKLTLRGLGQLLGLKHPQTVKNFLVKYKISKLLKEEE